MLRSIHRSHSLFALLAPLALVACGGSSPSADTSTDASDSGADGGGSVDVATEAADETANADAGPETPDHGAPSTTYPAFASDIAAAAPKLNDSGGPIISAPVAIAVTWPVSAAPAGTAGTDADAAEMEAFVGKLAGSDYWKTTTSEYGVGALTADPAVHLDQSKTAAPTSDTDARAMIVANAVATGSTWPAPSSSTIYVLFLPETASAAFTLQGQPACSNGIGGYHDYTGTTAFAVVLRCSVGAGAGITADEFATLAASHELAEAATDPEVDTQATSSATYDPAYSRFRTQDRAWNYFQGGASEIGDNCELYDDFATKIAALADTASGEDGVAQRLWSNQSFAAGHGPCVPVPSAPYFNAVPLGLAMQTYTRPGGTKTTTALGVNIPVGTSATFAAGFYSDAAVSPWSFMAIEGNGIPGSGTNLGFSATQAAFAEGNLAVSADATTGQNGEKVYVTVKVNKAEPTYGANLVTLISYTPSTINPLDYTTWTATSEVHYFPVLITSTASATTTSDAGTSTASDASSSGG